MRNSRRRAARRSSETARDRRSRGQLQVETLEPRTMLSAAPWNALATPDISFFTSSTQGMSIYSPAQIRHAYGFDQVSWNGAGQTIAIVDAYDDPTIAADLHKFDQQWGLSDPNLSVYKQVVSGKGPAVNSGWDMEIALDVEWAHAMAPGANILLCEANSASLNSLLSTVDYARHAAGVSVVSMSWGSSEFSGEGAYDSYFTTPTGHTGVTFVASSGDNGAPASWPSISNNVVAVGGTTLHLGAGNTYGSETGWKGSGGGYSPYESEPTFQRGFQNTGHRSNPDVSYDADPNSGFYVYDGGSWYAVGGTSAGAPQWSALFAIANQGRAAAGRAALGGNALQAIYSLSTADFHDVTSGNNGYSAGVGYDAVTGRGSPVTNLVVRDLVAYGATTATASTAKPATGSGGNTTLGHSTDWSSPISSPGSEAPVDTSSAALGLADQQSAPVGKSAGSDSDTLDSASSLTADSTSVAPSTRRALDGDRLTDGLPATDDGPIAAGLLSAGSDAGATGDLTQAFDRIDNLVDQFFDSGAMTGNAALSPDAVDACLAGSAAGDA